MTRILAVTLRYPPYVEGGYEILTRDAVEGLRKLGNEVAVLCGKGQAFEGQVQVYPDLAPAVDGGGNLFVQDRKSGTLERLRNHFFRGRNYAATRAAIRDFRPELVLYFNLGLASVAPLVAARMERVPQLGYLCDRWAENLWLTDAAKDPGKRGRYLVMARIWSVLRSVAGLDQALCSSEWIRRRLLASGVQPAGIGVLPTGLSPEMDRLARLLEGPAQRAQGERLRLICTSMLWHGKGQHVLVEAFGRAVAEGLDAELFLAGEDPGAGEYLEGLQQLAREARVQDRIHFAGLLTPAELSKQLAHSHIFVLPSIWGEPFGLSTIEAMAHGTCAVVTNSGASPELVGDAGVVAATNSVEALVRIFLTLGGDEERRQELGQRGRARALSQFARTQFLERLDSTCRSLAQGGELGFDQAGETLAQSGELGFGEAGETLAQGGELGFDQAGETLAQGGELGFDQAGETLAQDDAR